MAQISSESRNSFKKIMRAAIAETRVQKKLLIITLVLYGVAFLLFAFNADYNQSSFSFEPSGVGAVFAVFGVLVGFFAVLNVFRDMNNQQFCDISMALPLRAGERFFSRLLSLFFLQIAPLLVSTVLGNALAMLIGFFRFGEFPELANMTFFTFPLAYFAGSLFIMAVTVLCVCCCGAMAESAYFSLILMFIINFLPQSFLSHLFENCAGYQTGFVRYTLDGFDFLRYWGFLYLFGDTEKMIPYCLVGSLISVAVMLLSGLIYRRRDARTVGTPIASRVFFEIVMFLGCATVFSFFAFEDAALWGVLIAAVIYIIINIIVSRAKIGVKSVLIWVGKYLATTAVCVAVFTAASVTGGFGVIGARPEARYLEGARISVHSYDGRGGINLSTDPLSAAQADQVMEICKKHMIAGRQSIGAAFVWKDYPAGSSRVYLSMNSEVTYPERPFPAWQFREHTVYTVIESGRTRTKLGSGGYLYSDGGYTYVPDGTYQLDFTQIVLIADAEAEAMMKELRALDFMYVQEANYTEGPLDPATGLPVETAAQTYDPDYEYAAD